MSFEPLHSLFLTFSFLFFAERIPYLISIVVVLYSSFKTIPLSAQSDPVARKEKLRYMVWRLYSVSVLSVPVPSDNVLCFSASP